VSRQARLNCTASRLRVVAGILQKLDGSVLVADRARCRSMRDYWEFPGGKLAAGESAEQALLRELAEELGIRVAAAEPLIRIEHDYPDLAVAVEFFLVSRWHGEPAGLEGQALRWVSRDALAEANLLPADAPVIEALQAR